MLMMLPWLGKTFVGNYIFYLSNGSQDTQEQEEPLRKKTIDLKCQSEIVSCNEGSDFG